MSVGVRVRVRVRFIKRSGLQNKSYLFGRRHVMLNVQFRKYVEFAAHQVWQR